MPLEYPFATLPAPGEAVEIQPGVLWLRMPLPFTLTHINLWAIADEDERGPGWAVVDTGTKTPEVLTAWRQLIAPEGPLAATPQGARITRVFCTHMHPDHIGLAHWLCAKWNAPLWISGTDFAMARIGTQTTTGFGGDGAARFFASHGLADPAALEQVRARSGYYPGLVPALPSSHRRLLDGMVVQVGGRSWRCIAGYGHAPEHMALHCDSLRLLNKASIRTGENEITGEAILYNTVTKAIEVLGDKPRILALNKCDALDGKTITTRRKALEKASGGKVHVISGAAGMGLQDVLRALYAEIQGAEPVKETGPWQT